MQTAPLDLIDSINKCLARSADPRRNFRELLDTVNSKLPASRSFLLLHDRASDSLSLASASGLDVAEYRRLEARCDSGFFRDAFAGKREVLYEDAPAELAIQGDERLAVVPVELSDTAFGLLAAVTNGSSNAHQVLRTLRVVGSLIAQSLRIQHIVMEERRRLLDENSHLKQELKERHDLSQIVGTSNPMKLVYDQVSQVARSNATVLLRGESGTGKEMIANALHYNSLRSKRPFVKINCAALPDTLIESELFGHEKGAFTGAERAKKGRFELADGGTLFLDEIGDLPVQTQIKLLRVLQEREFERLGGAQPIRTNIRLITATNKNLEDAISKGEFREDLYYRLNVFTIFLPPLRERKSDILLLAEHFLEKYEKEYGKRIRRISTPAIDMLMSYHFPGNVRELENAIERAVLVCDSNVIHGHHLPPTLQTAEVSGTVTNLTLASAVAAFERDLIQDTLKSTGGNVAGAARALDSTERILGYKIKKYGIDPRRFRR
jgi:Nif-specific regulatory protein